MGILFVLLSFSLRRVNLGSYQGPSPDVHRQDMSNW